MQPKFVTIQTWVELSGIGRSTSYKLLAAGELHARKIGRRVLIDFEAGMAWLAAQPAAVFHKPESVA
jgi:excisionase family DNA binding protein